MRFLMGMLAALSLATCGVNEVTIRVEGGDGNKIRVDLGSFDFKEVKEGSYAVNVVANEYVGTSTLEVDSPPLSGIQTYDLTVTVPGGSNPSYRPEGTILYAATPTKIRDWELYTIEATGGKPVQLTDTREFEQHPSWSPDGQDIVFTRGEVMTNIDIYVMAADGSAERRLTEHAERDEHAAWSPDGTTIAFDSQRDGDVSIWLMDADGSSKRKLTNGRYPEWSPDGKTIAFTNFVDASDEIFTIGIDGSNLRRLTQNKYIDWFPSYSPDGRRLAFNSERFGGEELIVSDARGGTQVRVTVAKHTFEQDPDWSPDGRGMVYQGKMNFREDGELDVHFSNKTGKHRPQGTFDIFVVSAVGFDWDDTDEHLIMPVNLTNTTDYDEWSPSWRPNQP